MTIDFNSKKMQHFYTKYKAALDRGDWSIENVYKDPSDNKIKAWQDVCKICTNLGGTGLAVISHTVQYFTAAFMFKEDGRKFFLVETAFGQYISEVPDGV